MIVSSGHTWETGRITCEKSIWNPASASREGDYHVQLPVYNGEKSSIGSSVKDRGALSILYPGVVDENSLDGLLLDMQLVEGEKKARLIGHLEGNRNQYLGIALD